MTHPIYKADANDAIRMLADYIEDNARNLAELMFRAIYIEGLFWNSLSDEENDGAELVLKIDLPSSERCTELYEGHKTEGVPYPA